MEGGKKKAQIKVKCETESVGNSGQLGFVFFVLRISQVVL